MKKKLLCKRSLFLGLAIIVLHLPFSGMAQSVKRQCISSYGPSTIEGKILLQQTVGQSYSTAGSSESSAEVIQGFQQPQTFTIEEIALENEEELEVSVYPNPASYSITIESKEEIEKSFIRVLDITGKQVISEEVPNLQEHFINCTNLENGTYFINVNDENQKRKTLKLIISK